jgi:dihydroxy-acid dehydratase
MGTASTMTSAVEALGVTMPGAASIPAADSDHPRMAVASGRRIVSLPASPLTLESFENAISVVLALGGSTNAVIHLIAMAGRAGIPLSMDRFDALSRTVPVLANIRPSGAYLMQDFFEAGGLRALMSRLELHDVMTVSGLTVSQTLEGAEVFDDDVIRPRSNPLSAEAGLAILSGSLAPDGCVIKHSAASESLLSHTGAAVVFEDPGMPEWGMLPIPKKLLEKGVRDMVRISDARMSGTAYGTCVLHVAPESFVGGPLALVRTGDQITLDVPARRLDLLVSEEELAERRLSWVPRQRPASRGYTQLFADHVTQANEGRDFDFLHGAGGVPEPAIH